MNIDNVLVCVTQQKTCERLILNGSDLVKNNGNLYVIHVVEEGERFLNQKTDGEALEYLFGVSKNSGANLTVLKSNDMVKTIENFAKDHKINKIVIGKPKESKKGKNIVSSLKKALPNVEFVLL